MLTTTVIKHKGKKIVYMDFRGVILAENKARILELIDESEQFIAGWPPNSVLALTHLEGSQFDLELVKRMQRFTRQMFNNMLTIHAI